MPTAPKPSTTSRKGNGKGISKKTAAIIGGWGFIFTASLAEI
jgi:hypothetical protein